MTNLWVIFHGLPIWLKQFETQTLSENFSFSLGPEYYTLSCNEALCRFFYQHPVVQGLYYHSKNVTTIDKPRKK